MSITFHISILVAFLTLIKADVDKMMVACLGDSITFGARLQNPSQDSYPAHLQKILGNNYEVINFGVGGSTLLRKGSPTVWTQLSAVRNSNPNIIIVSLGTNDTCGKGTCGDRKCWEYKNEFQSDYMDFIDSLQSFPTKPKIWICAPSPMVLETSGLSVERVSGLNKRKPRLQKLIKKIKRVVNKKQVNFIDLTHLLIINLISSPQRMAYIPTNQVTPK